MVVVCERAEDLIKINFVADNTGTVFRSKIGQVSHEYCKQFLFTIPFNFRKMVTGIGVRLNGEHPSF